MPFTLHISPLIAPSSIETYFMFLDAVGRKMLLLLRKIHLREEGPPSGLFYSIDEGKQTFRALSSSSSWSRVEHVYKLKRSFTSPSASIKMFLFIAQNAGSSLCSSKVRDKVATWLNFLFDNKNVQLVIMIINSKKIPSKPLIRR